MNAKFPGFRLSLVMLHILVLVVLLSTLSACRQDEQFCAINLSVNYIENPLGLDDSAPRLGWQLSGKHPVLQSAYQVLVATSPELLTETLADCWNSGRIYSPQNQHIVYKGKELLSGKCYFWKVRVWDQDEIPSEYSPTGRWETGYLKESAWKGKWISAVKDNDSLPPLLPAPCFRKEFSIKKKVESARLYISGLGYYVSFINGQKVGDSYLSPSVTRYDRRVIYNVYDVTGQIKSGNNAIGVVLGNGWYNQHTREAWDFDKAPWRNFPTLLCQLEIAYTDGSKEVILSDETWCFSFGPITFNGIHNGEFYDARLEQGSWTESGYNDIQWEKAYIVSGPAGKLSPQLMPPIRITNPIKPVKQWRINDSTTMYDLGCNIAGWASIKVKGPRGSKVTLRYGERINDDGTLDQKELSRFIRTGLTQTGRYTLKGGSEEFYRPSFTYHGFQYIEVSSSSQDIEIIDLTGEFVHTDLRLRGDFKCSNEMFNTVFNNLKSSFLGNYHSYPTDCPHREKIGWSGDALLVAETGLFTFDLVTSYLKWIDDFMDEQQPTGQLPGIIPTSGWGYTFGSDPVKRQRGYGPQWEGAFMEIPWQIYRYTGDTSVIVRYYDGFVKYVDYLTNHSVNYLLDFGIDDHKQLVRLTEGGFLASAFYFHFSNMLSSMARIAGKPDDAEKYASLAIQIKKAFNEKFYDNATGLYYHGGQTPLAIALWMGLTTGENKEIVSENLLKAIEMKDGHIDGGVVGTKAVINALLAGNRQNLLYEMANKRTFPGWGFWVDSLKATTLFQNWDGSQSRNHIMFGSIGDYFFKGLAGINIDDNNPGFGNFLIKPMVNNDIEWVMASHETLHGLIETAWRKEGNKFRLELTIPANTSAQVMIPAKSPGTVKLNKSHDEALKFFTSSDGEYSVYQLKSGRYVFTSTYNVMATPL